MEAFLQSVKKITSSRIRAEDDDDRAIEVLQHVYFAR